MNFGEDFAVRSVDRNRRGRLDSIINAYVRETTGRPADPAQLSRAAAAIKRRGKLDPIERNDH